MGGNRLPLVSIAAVSSATCSSRSPRHVSATGKGHHCRRTSAVADLNRATSFSSIRASRFRMSASISAKPLVHAPRGPRSGSGHARFVFGRSASTARAGWPALFGPLLKHRRRCGRGAFNLPYWKCPVAGTAAADSPRRAFLQPALPVIRLRRRNAASNPRRGAALASRFFPRSPNRARCAGIVAMLTFARAMRDRSSTRPPPPSTPSAPGASVRSALGKQVTMASWPLAVADQRSNLLVDPALRARSFSRTSCLDRRDHQRESRSDCERSR